MNLKRGKDGYRRELERGKDERNDVYFILISTIKEKMLMPNLRKFYNPTPENVMGLKLQPPERYLYTTSLWDGSADIISIQNRVIKTT